MRHAIGISNGNWRSGDLRREFREIAETPVTSREQALSEIKEILGTEEFESWYNKTYELRKAGKHDEYEAEIFMKLEKLQSAMSDVLDARICNRYGESL